MRRYVKCGCKYRWPRFARGELLKPRRHWWGVPMVLSGHGSELVGIVVLGRFRVWWKPAPCYDRKRLK